MCFMKTILVELYTLVPNRFGMSAVLSLFVFPLLTYSCKQKFVLVNKVSKVK